MNFVEGFESFRTMCGVQSSPPIFAPKLCARLWSAVEAGKGREPAFLVCVGLSWGLKLDKNGSCCNCCSHPQIKESRVRSGRNGRVRVEDCRGRRPREFAGMDVNQNLSQSLKCNLLAPHEVPKITELQASSYVGCR